MKKPSEINEEWHGKNVMPKNPSLEERIKWHIEHSKNCGCRPVPPKLLKEIRKRRLRIGSIVIDCDNFDRMAAFWQEALHYVPGRPPDDGFVILKDPTGGFPNVSVNRKDRPMVGPKKQDWRLSDKIRLHLDLYANDQEAEVQRLVKLGAKIVHRPGKAHDYVVLADPEDNHFCVIDASMP